MADVFPDPLGVGSRFSLMLAIFGELVCSFGFLIGFLYRLAMIPMIFTMAMAFFVIHSQDAFAVRELAVGVPGRFRADVHRRAGKFAVDRYFAVKERGR